jgi:predicted secreted protein
LKRLRAEDPVTARAADQAKYWRDPDKARLKIRTYRAKNSEKMRAMDRKYYADNWVQKRACNLKSKFGISMADYERILAEQGGVCAICKKAETAKWRSRTRRLAVDHDHDTDEVRGLLCMACNMGIGMFADEPDVLEVAAKYLRSHSSKGVEWVPNAFVKEDVLP